MTVAAVLAATMGTAALAAVVPGLPTGVFQAQGDSFDMDGAGVVAITNINDILNSVGGTAGANISTDMFWSSFAEPTKTQVFNYADAKPLIAELIFTVSGEVNDNGTWKDTSDTDTWGSSCCHY